MDETDPEELADQLEHEADELERHRDKLARDTDEASTEWERKRSDPGVPGAPPPEDPERED